MKKRNIYEKRLNTYRELLKKFIDEEEVRVALEQPVRLNLTNVHYYSAYYQGARMGILRASEWMLDRIKGEEKECDIRKCSCKVKPSAIGIMKKRKEASEM